MARIFVEKSGSERYELCMSKPELEYLHRLLKQVQGPTGSVGDALDEFFKEERLHRERLAKERESRAKMIAARRALLNP